MRNTHNVTLGLLVVSALLLSTLLVSLMHAPHAQAEPPARGGEYIQVTGAWDKNTDLLYVVDLRAQKMNVYFLNKGDGAMERLTTLDLQKAFLE